MALCSFVFTSSIFCFLLLVAKGENTAWKRYFFVPARKSKTNAIQLGGVALALGFFCTLIIGSRFTDLSQFFNRVDHRLIQNFIFGGLVISLYGYFDDKFELRPIVKLFGQIFSVLIYATLSSHLHTEHHSQITFLVICFWGLGVVNGSNLLDGLDTLTLKLGSVSYSVFLFLGVYHNSPKIVICSTLFLSCLVAFYYFNKAPAKIHLGEIGGSIVGFSLLLLSSFLWHAVKANQLSPVRSAVLAIIPLTLPMVELGISFLRRIYNKKSPFAGDHLHVHHILNQEYGFKAPVAATIMAAGYLFTMAVAIYIQILTHPYIALGSLIVMQVSIYIAVGRKYWHTKDSLSLSPRNMLKYLSKKDVLIIESSQIDNFKLTVLSSPIEEIDEESDEDKKDPKSA
ncbi:MAG: UDP-GlcNAc:undecaprenyl-phosphate GlcNAc-1-phosphate transferase [Bacteriovoracaceae bacterium]|jgi:UDP-GlcNAc:undecaprenyl-phosphate GlcNAc-1-phosphate transferase